MTPELAIIFSIAAYLLGILSAVLTPSRIIPTPPIAQPPRRAWTPTERAVHKAAYAAPQTAAQS